ncbi:hypothetical protein MRY87_07215 [bacterium]|nr:hypothetical protein [bacterium]
MLTPPELTEIHEKYEAFLGKPFPLGHRSHSIRGKNLALLQSEIGGYILTYTSTNGSLGTRQRSALAESLDIMREGIPDFTEEGKAYFEELIDLGARVLATAHDTPSFS